MFTSLYYISIGVSEYDRFQSHKKDFLNYESEKLKQYKNYQQYATYGFRIRYNFSPINIFFISI